MWDCGWPPKPYTEGSEVLIGSYHTAPQGAVGPLRSRRVGVRQRGSSNAGLPILR